MNTFSLAQVEGWIDRNMFIGSPEAARTAMEDAASLVPEQESRERCLRLLEKHGTVVCGRNDSLGLAYQEMSAKGLVDIEDGINEGEIEVTAK